MFMDPDMVELIGERFVALRLAKNMPAPFRSQGSYGMSGSTFGQAILLVTPDGSVVRETSTIQPQAGYAFLVDALARHPQFKGAPKPDDMDAGAWHLRRGELVRAEAALGKKTTAAAHRQLASLYRRQRKGKEALAEIRKARAVGVGNVDLALEEVLVLLRMARDRDAGEAIARLVKEQPVSAKSPSVMFWKGFCELRQKRRPAALRWWDRLIKTEKRGYGCATPGIAASVLH